MFLYMDQLQKQTYDNERIQDMDPFPAFKTNPEQREKTDTSNALDALDASSVIIESNRTESKEQIQAAYQGMMHMLMMQISDPYIMKSQCAEYKTLLKSKSLLQTTSSDNLNQLMRERTYVAKLLAENELLHKEKEHLKQTYKDLIKRTQVQTKNQNDYLMEQLNKKSNENADVLAQIQKKGFAVAALKNELRKLTGNSVNTKFTKPSILGKPVGQPLKNQSVVRQPTAFKSERPRISKPRFASQVDVNNNLFA
ncbi:hypothetical protein Tco_0520343 [Tanacetum coccineum]